MNIRVMTAAPITYDALLTEREAGYQKSMLDAHAKHRQERLNQRLQKVPLRFRHKTFADFKVDGAAQSTIKQIAERFTETFEGRLVEGNSLILHGKPGTGKTLLSLIIYQTLAHEDYGVSYEPSLHFLKSIQEKKFESYTAFHTLLDEYRHLPFLILDEITEGNGKDGYLAEWERSLLFTLIDTRYQAKRGTAVITNRSKAELTERLGTPIIDRLSENGLTMGFTWESYRRPKMY